jgi:hypothetical protein
VQIRFIISSLNYSLETHIFFIIDSSIAFISTITFTPSSKEQAWLLLGILRISWCMFFIDSLRSFFHIYLSVVDYAYFQFAFPQLTLVQHESFLDTISARKQYAAYQQRDKYEKMIARGPESYPYQLYLAYEAYRPAYAEVSYLPSLGDAAQMIRNAGGISGIAHYYTTKRHLSLEAISWLLENDVIDGMEVVYGSYYSGEQGNDLHAERKLLANVVNKQQKISMGGGDIHNIDDLQTYFTHREVANDSVGLTHKILSSGKVDTRWSSY